MSRQCSLDVLFQHRHWAHVDPFEVQHLLTYLRQLTESGQLQWQVTGPSAQLQLALPEGLGPVTLLWGALDDGAAASLQLGTPCLELHDDKVVELARVVLGPTQLAPTLRELTGLARSLNQVLVLAGDVSLPPARHKE